VRHPPWTYIARHLVRITAGRFYGEFGECIAHDGTMRIVEFKAEHLAGKCYRVHADRVEVIGEREH